MAQGRREYATHVYKGRDAWIALALAMAAAAASRAPAIGGKPLFGYLAAVMLILAASFAIRRCGEQVRPLHLDDFPQSFLTSNRRCPWHLWQ